MTTRWGVPRADDVANAGRRWFRAFADAGIDVDIAYAVLARGQAGDVLDEHRLSHVDVDGVAGLLRLVPDARAQTAAREHAPATMGGLLRVARKMRSAPPPPFTTTPTPGSEESVAWRFLDDARASSAHLLYALHASLMTTSKRVADRGWWMIPVDLRGSVGMSQENAASFIVVDAERELAPDALRVRIRAALRSNEPMSFVVAQHYAVKLGLAARAARAQLAHGPWWGAFSSLGHYASATVDCAAFAPFATVARPIGAGALWMNGTLGLGVRAHPTAPCTADELIGAWVEALTSLDYPR